MMRHQHQCGSLGHINASSNRDVSAKEAPQDTPPGGNVMYIANRDSPGLCSEAALPQVLLHPQARFGCLGLLARKGTGEGHCDVLIVWSPPVLARGRHRQDAPSNSNDLSLDAGRASDSCCMPESPILQPVPAQASAHGSSRVEAVPAAIVHTTTRVRDKSISGCAHWASTLPRAAAPAAPKSLAASTLPLTSGAQG